MRRENSYVINPRRRLVLLSAGERFLIGVKANEENLKQAEMYGLSSGDWAVPLPLGSKTDHNLNGRNILLRKLPKIEKVYSQRYRVKDWHGDIHTGYATHVRLCFQSRFEPGLCIPLYMDGDKILSELLINEEGLYEQIKTVMNVFIEIFGNFELLRENMQPIIRCTEEKVVNWEILRPGQNSKEIIAREIKRVSKNDNQRAFALDRAVVLDKLSPDCTIKGKNVFFGYVIYEFKRFGISIFESFIYGNATYIFSGDWEPYSKLTKQEVLLEHLEEDRIVHNDSWASRLENYFRNQEGK